MAVGVTGLTTYTADRLNKTAVTGCESLKKKKKKIKRTRARKHRAYGFLLWLVNSYCRCKEGTVNELYLPDTTDSTVFKKNTFMQR